jgi:enoyl-CoA hydratase/carnithine racemase
MSSGFREGLKLDLTGSVARLTLDRPESRNALSRDLLASLSATLDDLKADRSVRVVVLAAEGPVFCSGHDLRELAGAAEQEQRAIFAACSRMMLSLRELPQPVIARVQGPAVAAGCQLVASCDMAVAAEEAAFSTPGVQIGLFCTTPMVPLVRAVVPKAAFEMLVTGRPVPARRALEIGLVNRVVPAERLDAAVAEIAGAIVAFSPEVIRCGKADFYHLLPLAEPDAYDAATEIIARAVRRPAAVEGIAAFLEKRAPRWPDETDDPT